MKTNFITKAWEWVKNLFKKKTHHLTAEILDTPVFNKTGRPERGAYFHNNRKRTRGRNIQYVAMPNGKTKLIRHETISK
jgi:hypothetical protein